MFPPSKKGIHGDKSDSDFLHIHIPIHVKRPHNVRHIPIGRPQVIESINEPNKTYVKVKYLRRERVLSKY